jgi:hypothetical protein
VERKKSSDAELLCGELIYSNRMLCVLVYVYTQYIYLFIFMCADSVTNIYIYIYIYTQTDLATLKQLHCIQMM